MKKHTPAIHTQNCVAPTHENIAALAQHLYEEEGCPDGRADEHWLQAEHQLRDSAGKVKASDTSHSMHGK